MANATKQDWLLKVPDLQPKEILTIHPRDGLEAIDVLRAMKAQGYNCTYEFAIQQHGSKIWIQRLKKAS